MKKILFLPFIFLAISASCQVNFENLSFDGALQKSKQTGKLIFAQFESDGCLQCNEVADKAFENQKLSELLEQTFICIKIAADNPDRTQIASKYNKRGDSFGSMFISSDGTLIHTYMGSSTSIKTYEEHVDKALTKAGEGLRVSELEKLYTSGNKNPGLLELLMQTRRTLSLATDSLLEEYITLLPADSFKSERTLAFIAEMAPLVGTKAYYLLRKDYPLFLKAWQSMTATMRIGINNRIGYKSLQKAIHEKNEAYAYQVASFVRSTYSSNPQFGQKAFDSKMVDYYKGVDDTLKYIQRAIAYYDNYYMTIAVDSIKKQDSLNMRKLVKEAPFTSEKKGDSVIQRRTIKYTKIVQFYNRELNNAAFSFYELTTDPIQLSKALQWSARANEFIQTYTSMNTQAQLLFKTGKKEEAVEWQNKAIAMKKKLGFDTKSLEKELLDMQNGK